MEEEFKKIREIQKEIKDQVIPSWGPSDIPGIDPIPTHFDGKLMKGALLFYGGTGCTWNTRTGGCFICPYSTGDEKVGVTQENVRKQIEFLRTYDPLKELELVYLFPCSAFDEKEISLPNQRLLWEVVSELDNLEYVVFESRPEYITRDILEELSDVISDKQICVYIGLETSNDFIRKYCINKGYTFNMFKRKCELLQELGMSACAFLLLKPPFLTEKEAIQDCVSSIKDTVGLVRNIILMVANTAHYTIMESLSEMGVYKPVWLWSVTEVLQQLDKEERKKVQLGGCFYNRNTQGIADFVQVEHTPAFYQFPENCGKCDVEVIKRLMDFNQHKQLEDFWCTCKKDWEKELQEPSLPLQKRLPTLYEQLIRYVSSSKGEHT